MSLGMPKDTSHLASDLSLTPSAILADASEAVLSPSLQDLVRALARQAAREAFAAARDKLASGVSPAPSP